ncbi:MAG: tRNA pseudouridine(55) synthase TruB [Betaproteobacteria bacterium]|nr:tRNA pseudouridine(55) synthase TruB [Betaproteobacteria bacterium]
MARTWRRVDGVLPLDKPAGMTSNAALQAARRIYNAEKAGHGGTLDPLASGMLPILFGQATRFSAWLLDADKTYLASVQLGVTTQTADAEGAVLETRPVQVDLQRVDEALARFRGEIEQLPPMYSALKIDGRPLYELARQGISVERTPRRVRIARLDRLGFSGTRLELHVTCSKGTYIRTLAEDIGGALGCGAHLAGLRRIAAGKLDIGQAIALDALASLDERARAGRLISADSLLAGLAEARLDPADSRKFCHGQCVGGGFGPGESYRVYADQGIFLGIGVGNEGGMLQPRRLVCGGGLENAATS